MKAQPRFMVTGGAGFIGSHLADALVRQGERVRVLDNFSTGHRENLGEAREHIDLLEGDVRDLETCRQAVRGVDCVFHQAALASVARSIEDPLTVHAVNVEGTLNVLIAARDAGVRRVVCASSSAVYGARGALPRREDDPAEPLSPYAASKLAGEIYCSVFGTLHGLETVSLRYFNVFGPRQDEDSQYAAVIPAFVRHLLAGEPPVIYGDGEQSRDFTFVENVVRANLLAATAPGARGAVLNIACGERFTLNTLLARLREITGCDVQPRFEAPRPGDIPHSQAAIGRAAETLGYRPVVSFAQGLRQTVEWFRTH